MTRTILFAGGGTAGHVYPALAVAAAVAERESDLEPVFVGTEGRLEGRLVPASGYRFHHIDALPLPRRPSLGLFKLPAALRSAIRRCEEIITQERAVGAVTFGGYVSFPLDWACGRTDIPLVIHEQNSVPGIANQFAARWADRIAVTFPGSAERFRQTERVSVTGNPVRADMLNLDRERERAEALRHFRLHQRRRTVLVFGGSQGARSLNRATVSSYTHWGDPSRVQILHAAGRTLYGEAASAWERARAGGEGPLVRCVDYIDDMRAAYSAADVVVCRAGATSIAEITALGLPAVLVPYPHATRDHQLVNARSLAQIGAARIIEDDELDGRRLASAVQPLLYDQDERDALSRAARAFGRRDAAEVLARIILEVVGQHQTSGVRT